MNTYTVTFKGWGHVSTRRVRARSWAEAIRIVRRELGIEASVKVDR